ncbi:hypothetical protein ACSDR0_38180 [Streptosporangium sp. G11]|uniref:hypothetical protein n=1 Tax=Streptosporangium sp. G11 TaxID=3436926 RepID=UPI003EBE497C
MTTNTAVTGKPRGRHRFTASLHRPHPRRWPFWAITAVVFTVMAASSAPSALYGLYQQRWHFGATMSTVIYSGPPADWTDWPPRS